MSSDSDTSSSEGPNPEAKIMTFHPTKKQFSDFPQYIRYLESQGANRAGAAKIIPPAGWTPNQSLKANDYKNIMDTVIPNPIEQKMIGTRSTFMCAHETKEAMTMQELYDLSKTSKYATPMNASSLEELESKYWRQIAFTPPIYGSDTKKTFFNKKDCKEWNLSHLDTLLNSVKYGKFDKIKDVPGVVSPYVYIGMWKSSFCWHKEDCNLYSVSYLHYGDAKQWYVIWFWGDFIFVEREIIVKHFSRYLYRNRKRKEKLLNKNRKEK